MWLATTLLIIDNWDYEIIDRFATTTDAPSRRRHGAPTYRRCRLPLPSTIASRVSTLPSTNTIDGESLAAGGERRRVPTTTNAGSRQLTELPPPPPPTLRRWPAMGRLPSTIDASTSTVAKVRERDERAESAAAAIRRGEKASWRVVSERVGERERERESHRPQQKWCMNPEGEEAGHRPRHPCSWPTTPQLALISRITQQLTGAPYEESNNNWLQYCRL